MSILTNCLSANLSFLFTEWPFLDRFAAAADAGFTCVEFLFPYAFDAHTVAQRLDDNGLSVSVFNALPGNWEAGERGLAALRGREQEFRESIHLALSYADALTAKHIHIMAGIADPHDQRAWTMYRDNLDWALERASAYGVRLLVEPINDQDIPGYFLRDFGVAKTWLDTFPNIRPVLQFDIYHCQKIHGSVMNWLHLLLPDIVHMQIAGVPARNEPTEPDLPLTELFAFLKTSEYSGRVGCEYHPAQGTLHGLGWVSDVEELLV